MIYFKNIILIAHFACSQEKLSAAWIFDVVARSAECLVVSEDCFGNFQALKTQCIVKSFNTLEAAAGERQLSIP